MTKYGFVAARHDSGNLTLDAGDLLDYSGAWKVGSGGNQFDSGYLTEMQALLHYIQAISSLTK
ncbi:hypothetical protein [Pontibacillus sp. HMF3514]|uniref:hypothetical protein n=1 Tax=Pontibacillus sp. HMF3514 TaxID=2692425 RepID=UPI00131FED24|nr:hypothetical protein [Pontibacillus sp. HMF3514]QHE53766.1 hypothetical protein GS400_17845 [Pontibacillus sp. HMF3514]